jgi:hypothetical protein
VGRIRNSNNPLHVAFAKHLEKVSTALHELEWVLSGDTTSPEEEPAIRAVISPEDELNSAREEAETVLKNLEQAIKRSHGEIK